MLGLVDLGVLKMSSDLHNQLTRHEGLRLKPYRCTSGKLSIGIGRNLDGSGISEREAELMLENDILKLFAVLPGKIDFFNELDKVRADILVNMAFNMGVNGLLKFKKMLAAVEVGDYVLAASEMLDSRWSSQVGNRSIELSEQMITGEYSYDTY